MGENGGLLSMVRDRVLEDMYHIILQLVMILSPACVSCRACAGARGEEGLISSEWMI